MIRGRCTKTTTTEMGVRTRPCIRETDFYNHVRKKDQSHYPSPFSPTEFCLPSVKLESGRLGRKREKVVQTGTSLRASSMTLVKRWYLCYGHIYYLGYSVRHLVHSVLRVGSLLPSFFGLGFSCRYRPEKSINSVM